MRWQLKATVQKGLDVLPMSASERMIYVLQRRVTRSQPIDETQLLLHFDEALAHVRNYEQQAQPAPRPLSDVRAFEFGAGWDLAGPLAMYSLGLDEQVIVDIRSLVRWKLVAHVMSLFTAHHEALERRAERQLRPLGEGPIESAEQLQRRFGIAYRAPYDARRTAFAEDSFDLISSTFTLEHIPGPDIVDILRECGRVLAPGGVISSSIDMQDHYSFVDPRISPYNFLRYSDRVWGLINSRSHYQNRLRARDYVELHRRAGLTLIDCRISTPAGGQERRLAAVPLAGRFARGYSPAELAVTTMSVSAR